MTKDLKKIFRNLACAAGVGLGIGVVAQEDTKTVAAMALGGLMAGATVTGLERRDRRNENQQNDLDDRAP